MTGTGKPRGDAELQLGRSRADDRDRAERQNQATFTYDGDGNRRTKSSGGQTTTYVNDARGLSQVLQAISTTGTVSYGAGSQYDSSKPTAGGKGPWPTRPRTIPHGGEAAPAIPIDPGPHDRPIGPDLPRDPIQRHPIGGQQHHPRTAHQPGRDRRPPRQCLQGRSFLVTQVHNTGAAWSRHSPASLLDLR